MTLTKALLLSQLLLSHGRWGWRVCPPALCDGGDRGPKGAAGGGSRTAELSLRTLAGLRVRIQLQGGRWAGLCHRPHRHRQVETAALPLLGSRLWACSTLTASSLVPRVPCGVHPDVALDLPLKSVFLEIFY